MSNGRKLALTLAFAGLIALAFGASCNGFFVDPVLTGITIGPTDVTLDLGETQQMVATGTFDGGRDKDVTGSCTWQSSDETVATVGLHTGKVVAATSIANPPVTATIKASDGTFSDSTTITVCPTVTKLVVDADTKNPQPNDDVHFTATATIAGAGQDVTAEVTWIISDTTVISSIGTDGIGTVLAGTSGKSTNVSAKLCNVTSATITINVQ
jgi:hypothetical protein